MFCNVPEGEEEYHLSCSIKLMNEIVTIFSIIITIIIIYVSARKIKMNVINKLILQILFSELVEGVNVILVVIDDMIGESKFENYINRQYVCYTQIFLSIFTCLWTLSSSFFISLRMYDIMVQKNRIFKTKIMENYTSLFSVFIPALISFIIWVIQVLSQVQYMNSIDVDQFYAQRQHLHFRYMFCWVEKGLNIFLFVFILILIGANIYFSIIKGSTFLGKIRGELKERVENDESSIAKKKLEDMSHIYRTLWIYPLSCAVIWIIYFIFEFCFIIGNIHNGFAVWVFGLLISTKQVAYVIIFLITQKEMRNHVFQCILCKGRKKLVNISSDNFKKEVEEAGEINNVD